MMTRDIERKLERATTVKDLIERLEMCDPDSPVLFVCDYGDYSHTQQALIVDDVEEIETSDLEESAYSNSGISRVEDGEYDEEREDEESLPVVILR